MEINKNPSFSTHNTSKRNGSIKYICIHYVGATGDAKANINYYNQRTSNDASADFYVGHSGDIWQYNPDPEARYCWAVGGKRQTCYGGSLHGIVFNSNSISIEMCVKNEGKNKYPNASDWYFTDETIEATIELTKYLMKLYGVPADRVIRHYDVTGKFCPGVVGWNPQSGSEDAWNDFKKKISSGTASKITTTTTTKGSDTVNVELPILKKGSKGASVKALQQLLNAKGYDTKGVDGSFGANTLTALKRYQLANKLTVDGYCGAKTWGSLLGV